MVHNFSNETTPMSARDPMAEDYGDPMLITFIVLAYFGVQIGGNGLLAGIMSYEKMGQDAHKRSMINQLVYQACGFAILGNLTTLNQITGRLLFGPLSKFFLLTMFLPASIRYLK
jgi:hypothetical protein